MPDKLNPVEVIRALNDFRDLMKVCFIVDSKYTTIEIKLSSILIIPPNIDSISSSIPLGTDIGNTFKDIKSLKTILGSITLNAEKKKDSFRCFNY